MQFLTDFGWSVIFRQCRSNFPDAIVMSTDELQTHMISQEILLLDVRRKEEVCYMHSNSIWAKLSLEALHA